MIRHNGFGVDLSGTPDCVDKAMQALNSHDALVAALKSVEAFVSAMFGLGQECVIPEFVRTPLLNAPVKLGEIMNDVRRAIAEAEDGGRE